MPAKAQARNLLVVEPRGRYARRMPVVVDASVVAAALFYEPQRLDASEALDGADAHTPDLLDHELVSVALKKQRAGLGGAVRDSLDMLRTLEITRHRVDPVVQWELASQHDLSAHGAAYLALALELGCPLITFDRKLGAAATRVLRDS